MATAGAVAPSMLLDDNGVNFILGDCLGVIFLPFLALQGEMAYILPRIQFSRQGKSKSRYSDSRCSYRYCVSCFALVLVSRNGRTTGVGSTTSVCSPLSWSFGAACCLFCGTPSPVFSRGTGLLVLVRYLYWSKLVSSCTFSIVSSNEPRFGHLTAGYL